MFQDYLKQAELALAAYANLTTGNPTKTALVDAGMSDSQASAFAAKWQVIDQYTPTELVPVYDNFGFVVDYIEQYNGLSVTVFEDIATGQRHVAIRGTEVTNIGDLTADGGILLHGIPDLSDQYQNLKSKIEAWQANGVLSGAFTVAGHSLGGWLAEGLAVDFAASIEHTYVFNSPGVFGAVFGDLLQQINDALGTSFLSAPSLSSLSYIRASAGSSLIAGLGQSLSPPIGIVTEDQTQSDVPDPAGARNHSQRVLTDALAVYSLFAELSSTLTAEDIGTILKASGNRNAMAQEDAVNALGDLFQAGGAIAVVDDRDAIYTRMQAIRDTAGYQLAVQARDFITIQPLNNFSSSAIAAQAQLDTPDGLAYRYALASLNAFVITGDAAIHAGHNINGELDLYNPVAGTGALTDQCLKDRAKMLSWKMHFDIGARDSDDPLGPRLDKPYSEDWDSWDIRGDWDFIDHSITVDGQPLKLSVDGFDLTTFANHKIIFSSQNDDTLIGGELRDNLYGGAGDDILAGGSGNDYLEGGSGYDTYIINPGGGDDIVLDTDGQGVIKFGDIAAQGSTSVAEGKDWIQVGNSWTDKQNGLIYRLVSQVNGTQDLYINSSGGSVRVKDWGDGELGIELDVNTSLPLPTTDLTIVGDLQPVDFNPAEVGVQTQVDGLDNIIVSAEVAPGREDMLNDSYGNDHVLGLDGNDYINAWRGGDDRVEGGTGQDILVAGVGKDTVLGGVDSDVVAGAADDDRLYAETEYTIDEAYALGETQAASGQRGDLLDGGAGDDILVGEAGNDILLGGMGKDILLGLGGDDTIEGDANVVSADRNWDVTRTAAQEGDITKYNRNYNFYTEATGADIGDDDVIYGGAGNDWIFAGGGNDLVDGGADDDVVFGGAGNDIVLGQAGNDVLLGDDMHPSLDASLHGDDYLSGGDGDDDLWGGGGSDYLEGGAGNDVLGGDGENVPAEYEGNDVLDGGAGDDQLVGEGGNDMLVGGDGVDALFGVDGNDSLDGGAGDDQLVGGNGHDSLVGGDGTDTLFGEDGNDTLNGGLDSDYLDGGAGADIMAGGAGDDAYVVDDAGDVVIEAAGEGHDSVSSSAASFALPDHIEKITLTGAALVATGNAEANTLYGNAEANRLDGMAGSDTLVGGGGGDILLGGSGDDILLGHDGSDALEGGEGNDHLQGDAGDDALDGGDGADSLLGGAGNDTLFGDAGNDELQGDLGDDLLVGGSGDDMLFGQEDRDTLEGGAGNDVLLGNAGDDTYLFNLGDGQDVIWEEGDSAGDVLRFGQGIAPVDVLAARSGYDLLLIHANGEDQVTIANWFVGTSWQLARFEFTDGMNWSGAFMGNPGYLQRGTLGDEVINGGSQDELLVGLGGNDQLYGNGGNDTLVGGKGSDTLTGGTGADTYLLSLGDGTDVVDSDTTDSLRFATNISSSEISAERVGYDLVLRHQNGTDSVKILNWYGSTNDQVQNVVFNSDGTTWSASTLNLMGVNYSNQYALNLGDGAKVIEDWGGVDRLVFDTGIAESDIEVARLGQDLRLSHVNGADQVTIKGWFAYADHSAWVEAFHFADGAVWSAEMLTGLTLTQVGTDGNDNLQGIDHFGDILRGGAGNDSLRGYSGNDVLEGGAGYDQLFGGDGNDTLAVGPDGGYADGGAGDDLYLHNTGDGNLSVGESAGNDTLRFGTGIHVEDVQFQKQYGSMQITLSDGGHIVINSWFNSSDYSRIVERFEFADGTVLMASELNQILLLQEGTAGNDTLNGTALDDTLIGAAGNDVLYGGAGNDHMDGGAGNDYLVGAAGNDDYRELGLGQDRILDSGGLDNLYFASDVLPENLILSRVNADLRIGFSGWGDSVTLQEWFRQPRNSIEAFFFADGSQLSAADINSSFSLVSGNGSLTGTVGDDVLYGGVGQDTLQGDSGNDLLDGGAGADSLMGGVGDDTYVADGNDTIFEQSGEGVDTLVWTNSAVVVLQDELENLVLAESAGYQATGNAANNRIVGNSLGNSLDGGAEADILEGGLGDDTYYVDNPGDLVVERAGEGNDSVYAGTSYALAEHVEMLTLTGSVATNGYGNELDNSLRGNDAANLLVGGAGNDVLTGGLGTDTAVGGSGDDVYYLDGYDDVVVEGNDEGSDRIVIHTMSGQSGNFIAGYKDPFVMAENIESLLLTGYVSDAALYGNALDNVIDARGAKIFDRQTGSVIWYYLADVDIHAGAGNDTLYASGGDCMLDGGLGDDWMYGGGGADTYYVDSELDQVIESSSSGSDTVRSTISYTLGTGLENLYLLGNAAINGTGNELSNVIVGNGGSNVLIGGAGNDRLEGGGGNDTLVGGIGDDTYVLSSSGLVVEQANEGMDRVEANISYSLGAHLEHLALTGSAAIDGAGNELDNQLQGNYAKNRLVGGAGNDTLDGGAGNDTMLGGVGDDNYFVDSTKDVVTEYASEGVDTVHSSVTYTLDNNLENLILTGYGSVGGTGNALNNVLIGNVANNTLSGGAGNDWLDGMEGSDKMLGGTGDDTYVVDISTDNVVERSNEGTDRVLSNATYTLSSNVENLTLTGTTAINGTGNALNNVLIGNSAANALSGGAGNDTLEGMEGTDFLTGGKGNDTYIMGLGYGSDTVVENDTTSGNMDVVRFLSGMTADQIWFRHVGNNLEAGVIGTDDRLVIQDWYLGNAYRVEQFKTADGAKALLDSNVQNLVNAMASFVPPAAGQTTLPTNYQDALAGVIAANWQ